jgi:NitT/TauT family transport system ATP-binding protein
VNNVSKSFAGAGDSFQKVLDDVTLRVNKAEFVCILGPTGCGKSTLLNLIAGFDTPDTGSIIVSGHPVAGPGRDRAVVFQDANAALFGWLTVRQNISYALRLRGVPADQRDGEIGELLRMVNLTVDGDKYPHRLSGGGRQRAQIARALATNSEIILMDEPLASVDALTKLILQREIAALAATTHKTVVYITHDILEGALLSDRVVILTHGPGATIRADLRNTAPRPRSLGDVAVTDFVKSLEAIVLGDRNAQPREVRR